GDALRYRVPLTAATLAQGRIDEKRFRIVVARTRLVSPESIEQVDARIAEQIYARDQMSVKRFTTLVDKTVAVVDPDAVKRRRAHAKAERKVTVTQDRFVPGQSRITASLPDVDAALVDARLTAMAESVHVEDPRSLAQRRSDALIASSVQQPLVCLCPECVAATVDRESTPPADPDVSAGLEVPVVGVVIHVIANQSTLDGDDDEPGFTDDGGVIDADTVRELAMQDFTRSTGITREMMERSARMRYRPGKQKTAYVFAADLCCTWPGCNNRAWSSDVDHTEPYDHVHPERGPTEWWNLKPLCRFHHRMKTFTGWRDFTDEFGRAVFGSPTGHFFVGNAYRGTDLFLGLADLVPKPSDHPAREKIAELYREYRRRADLARRRWDEANPPPF
ncbi:DUF222 domain-containing protein, partial [Gordonia sp. NPDC003376]